MGEYPKKAVDVPFVLVQPAGQIGDSEAAGGGGRQGLEYVEAGFEGSPATLAQRAAQDRVGQWVF
ncbi:MAG TPA: hypothetical protein VII19_01550 [Acidimicrobiales bacterium]